MLVSCVCKYNSTCKCFLMKYSLLLSELKLHGFDFLAWNIFVLYIVCFTYPVYSLIHHHPVQP